MSFNPKEHITDLRGRSYLEVKWRLVWFRDEHPDGSIQTEVCKSEPLIVKATILDKNQVIATGHGSANSNGKQAVWTGREVEKAETAAIGRALAHAGYGTQFSGEDEGDDLADSPVEPSRHQEIMKRWAELWKEAQDLKIKVEPLAPKMLDDEIIERGKELAELIKTAKEKK